MHINIQPAEKQRLQDFLEVHSIFYTIQGEGPFAGHPAVFVRLAGCNLQCPGCDTEYTDNRYPVSAHEVSRAIKTLAYDRRTPGLDAPLVVITGGEPFRQDIAKLVRMLTSGGCRVQIETNGTLFVEGLPWDSVTIVCSPKAGKINAKLLPHIDAFKYVMSARSVDECDGLPTLALDHSASPRVARPVPGKPVYLQPMDEQDPVLNRANQDACLASCLRYGYIMQLQIHKFLEVQ
jgi:organic radical activating enzyme